MSNSTKATLFLCRFWGLTVGAIKTVALFSFIFLLNLAYLAPAGASVCFLPDGENCDMSTDYTGGSESQPANPCDSCGSDYSLTSGQAAQKNRNNGYNCQKCSNECDKYKCVEKSCPNNEPTVESNSCPNGYHKPGSGETTYYSGDKKCCVSDCELSGCIVTYRGKKENGNYDESGLADCGNATKITGTYCGKTCYICKDLCSGGYTNSLGDCSIGIAHDHSGQGYELANSDEGYYQCGFDNPAINNKCYMVPQGVSVWKKVNGTIKESSTTGDGEILPETSGKSGGVYNTDTGLWSGESDCKRWICKGGSTSNDQLDKGFICHHCAQNDQNHYFCYCPTDGYAMKEKDNNLYCLNCNGKGRYNSLFEDEMCFGYTCDYEGLTGQNEVDCTDKQNCFGSNETLYETCETTESCRYVDDGNLGSDYATNDARYVTDADWEAFKKGNKSLYGQVFRKVMKDGDTPLSEEFLETMGCVAVVEDNTFWHRADNIEGINATGDAVKCYKNLDGKPVVWAYPCGATTTGANILGNIGDYRSDFGYLDKRKYTCLGEPNPFRNRRECPGGLDKSPAGYIRCSGYQYYDYDDFTQCPETCLTRLDTLYVSKLNYLKEQTEWNYYETGEFGNLIIKYDYPQVEVEGDDYFGKLIVTIANDFYESGEIVTRYCKYKSSEKNSFEGLTYLSSEFSSNAQQEFKDAHPCPAEDTLNPNRLTHFTVKKGEDQVTYESASNTTNYGASRVMQKCTQTYYDFGSRKVYWDMNCYGLTGIDTPTSVFSSPEKFEYDIFGQTNPLYEAVYCTYGPKNSSVKPIIEECSSLYPKGTECKGSSSSTPKTCSHDSRDADEVNSKAPCRTSLYQPSGYYQKIGHKCDTQEGNSMDYYHPCTYSSQYEFTCLGTDNPVYKLPHRCENGTPSGDVVGICGGDYYVVDSAHCTGTCTGQTKTECTNNSKCWHKKCSGVRNGVSMPLGDCVDSCTGLSNCECN